MTNTTNHPAVIEAIRAGYRAASILPLEEAASHVREIHRSWKGGYIADVHGSLWALQEALGDVVGGWDVWWAFKAVRLAAVAATSSMNPSC